jgi:hypothetical protein
MRRLLIALLLVSPAACKSSGRTIKIPDSVLENPETPPRPESAVRPYVIKMSDGRRTWQVEIPVTGSSPNFSASIPLELGEVMAQPDAPPASEADREIIDAKRAAGEPVPEEAAQPGGEPRSYLATLAKVRALYARRQHELALVELVALDRQYPDDERILEMKGTLYRKLGRRDEAKKAWERVLALNPENRVVARALEQLEESP